MGGSSIRRLFEPGLNLRKSQEMVVLASHDVGQTGQISDNSSIAIVSIQPDDHLTKRHRLRLCRGDSPPGLPAKVLHDSPRCLPQKTSPSTDGYVLARSSSWFARSLLVCARYGRAHRPLAIYGVQRDDQTSEVMIVDGSLVVSHPHRRQGSGSPLDPRAHRLSPNIPEGEPTDLAETVCAELRPWPGRVSRASASASSGAAGAPFQTGP